MVAEDPVQSIEDAFVNKLRSFQPDLLAVSVMTGYFDNVIRLLEKVKPSQPVLLGGVHPTISPKDSLAPEVVDYICVGEGEEFLLELCERIDRGKDFLDIRNLGYKKGKNFKINKPRPFINMDELPPPDWALFDQRHLFRPFMGRVYSGSFYVMSRGCPFECTYCVNGALKKNLKECGRYFHYQSPATTARHLAALKEMFNATWFKFADDTITIFPDSYLEELAELIRPLGIMFGCSVRPETITKHKVELLKSMGCVAASLGIESGNPRLRKEILNRKMSNEQIEKAISLLKDADIRVSTFNMIGLPEETRENVFETIRLNKKLGVSAVNVYVVYPYPGTEINRNYQIELRDKSGKLIPVSEAAGFELSYMSRSEVEALLKTFRLYVSLPEDKWAEVRKAEQPSEEGFVLRNQLQEDARSLL